MTRNVEPLTGFYRNGTHTPWHVEPPRAVPDPVHAPPIAVVWGTALFLAAAAGSLIGWGAVHVADWLWGRK